MTTINPKEFKILICEDDKDQLTDIKFYIHYCPIKIQIGCLDFVKH